MPKRKTKKNASRKKKKENFIEEEVEEIERWMIERKKFLIKLAWVAGFIAVLLIVLSLV